MDAFFHGLTESLTESLSISPVNSTKQPPWTEVEYKPVLLKFRQNQFLSGAIVFLESRISIKKYVFGFQNSIDL